VIVSTGQRAALVLCVVLALGACSAARQAAEVQRLQARAAFERGVKHFHEREATQALTALREAIALDPTSALYRDTLGLVFSQLQRPDLALEQFEQAVALDPRFADARFHLGVALAESTRWAEAVAAYRKALSLPTLTVPDLVHQNLGLALYHLRRYPDAERELRFAISLTPDLQAAHYHLGLVLVAERHLDEARLAFRRAEVLGPGTPFGEAAAQRLKALGEGGGPAVVGSCNFGGLEANEANLP
jgi:Tfp pilus assembly protein PilF